MNMLRRDFLAMAGAASLVDLRAAGKNIPVGLELYSVRDQIAKDVPATVKAVAAMGYQLVEFFQPYFTWPLQEIKDLRKEMDDLGIKCSSTHNHDDSYTPEGLKKAIEYNHILGSKYLVLATAGRVKDLDGWKAVGDRLTKASEDLKPAGLRAGYHNHKAEFVAIDGKRPMDILAATTPKDVMLQFDVGTCVEAGQDPVAWIQANPGRINSVHCKDWAPGEGKGYRVLFGEGVCPWKEIFAAAESVGGVEFYLIEQEGSRFPSLETAQKCIDTWKKLKV